MTVAMTYVLHFAYAVVVQQSLMHLPNFPYAFILQLQVLREHLLVLLTLFLLHSIIPFGNRQKIVKHFLQDNCACVLNRINSFCFSGERVFMTCSCACLYGVGYRQVSLRFTQSLAKPTCYFS